MVGNLVVKGGGLTKPATVLVEKISDAVGGFAKPYQIERVAKAEAKAALIRTEAEIEIEALRLRAFGRFAEEQTRHQLNMESITGKAILHLGDDASPEDMENDWLANFFDKCRNVSEEDMQDLWARVLAGEANNPGRFSRKTINILSDMERKYAKLFQDICRYRFSISGTDRLLIFPD